MKEEMNNKEIVRQAIANMSDAEKAKVFPPIERKNFVVRENWFGRNQIITFVNNKNQRVTYNTMKRLRSCCQNSSSKLAGKSVATGRSRLTCQ